MITLIAIVAFILILAVAIGKGIKKSQRQIKEKPNEDNINWDELWP